MRVFGLASLCALLVLAVCVSAQPFDGRYPYPLHPAGGLPVPAVDVFHGWTSTGVHAHVPYNCAAWVSAWASTAGAIGRMHGVMVVDTPAGVRGLFTVSGVDLTDVEIAAQRARLAAAAGAPGNNGAFWYAPKKVTLNQVREGNAGARRNENQNHLNGVRNFFATSRRCFGEPTAVCQTNNNNIVLTRQDGANVQRVIGEGIGACALTKLALSLKWDYDILPVGVAPADRPGRVICAAEAPGQDAGWTPRDTAAQVRPFGRGVVVPRSEQSHGREQESERERRVQAACHQMQCQ